MKRTLLLLIFTLPLSMQAQIVYTGDVSDAGSRSDLGGVLVEWKHTGQSTYTNTFGDFSMVDQDLSADHNTYQFLAHSLVWQGRQSFDLSIISLDGRPIFTTSLTGIGGSYPMPRLDHGLYLLQLSTDERKETHKILSDGSQTQVVGRHSSIFRTSETRKDTLVFSKEGYFSREVVVSNESTHLATNLLRGNYENLQYFNELIAPLAFDLLSSTPSRSNYGGVQSVKLIYDIEQDLLYYVNTKRYTLHYTFAAEVLGYGQGHYVFNQTQYPENSNRYLHLATLNYYQNQDRYVLHFSSLSDMNCRGIKTLLDKIAATSFIGDRLFFYPTKPQWQGCPDLQEVSSEELYEGQNYQALNLTQGYGYLRKVAIDELDQAELGRTDIILVDGIPNDLSVVAGIITTEFQTPLSHINVLSNSRGTPNMALRDGWTNPELDQYIDELIHLEVNADTFHISTATLAEAQQFWNLNAPSQTVYLDRDLETSGLVDLQTANSSYLNMIGGKAANFAELLKLSQGGTAIPVPEEAFAIPFYYYQKHLENHGLNFRLEELLSDEAFQNNPSYRKASLETFRAAMISAPLDEALLLLVNAQIADFASFPSIRFRSSTNAEDLEDFSGAGLYDSYSAKEGHATKTVAQAIKKVWASLWNWRAYEERSYFKIDHATCAMGILAHRSFPDEDANGVLVTKNLYNSNHGFIINVQFGENSIVFPEVGVIHDQIMLTEWEPNSSSPFLAEYLTFSNLPEAINGTVMTDSELQTLGKYCLEIKKHFYYNLPHQCFCSFVDFGVDIEFKIDSQVSPRKIYIKQARLYK